MTELLTDEEIRALTVWESDEEIPAFKAGWRARMDAGIFERPRCPEGRAVHPKWTQNARVAWERGWEHADVVACFRTSPDPEEAVDGTARRPPDADE